MGSPEAFKKIIGIVKCLEMDEIVWFTNQLCVKTVPKFLNINYFQFPERLIVAD